MCHSVEAVEIYHPYQKLVVRGSSLKDMVKAPTLTYSSALSIYYTKIIHCIEVNRRFVRKSRRQRCREFALQSPAPWHYHGLAQGRHQPMREALETTRKTGRNYVVIP